MSARGILRRDFNVAPWMVSSYEPEIDRSDWFTVTIEEYRAIDPADIEELGIELAVKALRRTRDGKYESSQRVVSFDDGADEDLMLLQREAMAARFEREDGEVSDV